MALRAVTLCMLQHDLPDVQCLSVKPILQTSSQFIYPTFIIRRKVSFKLGKRLGSRLEFAFDDVGYVLAPWFNLTLEGERSRKNTLCEFF